MRSQIFTHQLAIIFLFIKLLLVAEPSPPHRGGVVTEIENEELSLENLTFPALKSGSVFKQCCPADHVVQNDLYKGITCAPVLKRGFSNGSFRSDNSIFNHSVYNESHLSETQSNGIPSCALGRPRILHNRDGIWFKIFTDVNEVKVGLDYFIWAAWIPVDRNSFCLGMVDDQSSPYNTTSAGEILVFCKLDDFVLTEFIIHRYIYGLSSISTCIPIIVTLVLFVHLKIYVNPRKWILMSYFYSYCCVCAVHGVQILVYVNNLEQQATFWCRLLNHMFLYLIAVFGTACMFVSLDIFWCFWSMNSRLGIIPPSKFRIIVAIISSWLVPLILYTVAELWRQYYATQPPYLAWQICMSGNYNAIQFLMAIQFVFKFGVYLSTSILIYNHKKSTSFATLSAQKDYNESKTLYAKLFVTTGMPFTCLALDYCFVYDNPMAWYWFVVRFPHSFIGLYIFLVFGLSQEVRRKWHQRHKSSQDKSMDAIKQSDVSNQSDFSRTSQNSNKSHNSCRNSRSSLLSIVKSPDIN